MGSLWIWGRRNSTRRKRNNVNERTTTGSTADTAPRRAWWGDRGVRTKVVAAVGVAALVAVVIGVLGLIALGTAAQRTQDLYDGNLAAVTDAETMSGALKDTRVSVRDVLLAADAATAQEKAAAIDDSAAAFTRAADAYASVPGSTADDGAKAEKAVAEYQTYVAQAKALLGPLTLAKNYAAWSAANAATVGPLATTAEKVVMGLVA